MSVLADELGGGAVDQARRILELQEQLQLAQRRHTVLRRAEVLRDRLLAVAVEGGDAATLAVTCARLLGRPCAITGDDLAPIAGLDPADGSRWRPWITAPSLRQDPTVADLLRTFGPTQETLLPPVLHLDARHRLLVGPPTPTGARVWLAERPGGFTALDRLAVRHATTALALLAGPSGPTASEDLVPELLAGTADDAELERRARHAGLDVGAGIVVLCGPLPAERLLAALAAADLAVLTAKRREGMAVLVGADPELTPDDALAQVREVAGPAVSSSGLIRRVADIPGAWADARTAAAARELLGPGADAEAALGPARLLLGSGDRAAVDAFVQETLGGLLRGEDGADALLATLSASFDTSHSVGQTAEALGVHENTVRYRLKRVEDRLGRSLRRPEHRLAIEVAILVLRLRGDARVAGQYCR